MPSPSQEPSSLSVQTLVDQLGARYIRGASFIDVFDGLLPELLQFTQATAGLIARLCQDEQGLHLEAVAHPRPSMGAAAEGPPPPSNQPPLLVLRDFNSLYGQVLASTQPVLRNHIAKNGADATPNPQAVATPDTWGDVEHFLGIPLLHGGTMVGLVALVNRPNGFDVSLMDALQPAIAVLSNIVGAIDLERSRREALLAHTQAQDSLARNEAYYQQIFEAAGVGIARVAPDGHVLDANQRFADICQRPRADMLRLNLQDVTHPDDLPVTLALMEATLNGHQDRFTMDKRYIVPMGGTVWVQANAVLVRDMQQQPLHFVAVVEDISERKRYQEAILSAQAAERASKAKTEFLSRMSHELRTPLNAMLGFAQLLRVDPREPLNDSQKQKVRYIEEAGSHLLAMLTDVLDLSRIEAGSLPLSLEPLRVGNAVQEALTMVAHQATQFKVTLAQTEGDTELFVRADQVRLRQILVNLLTNAIKYNRPQGTVRVEVQALRPHVVLSIHDTGQGMTPEQQAHLFEPFNRLGAERSAVEGTGIGLVIVKRLISLMHGRIEVSSVLGEGTVFRVVLPMAENPEAEALAAGPRSGFGELGGTADPAHPLTLLYAEDNAVNVELLRHVMLMRPRWQLEVASNGAEAISMALASPPDLLLLDMHLGDMTGLDVADTLAHHAHTMGVLKVALSADVMPDQVRAAKDRGFVEYLTKPLDLPKLLRLLDGFSAEAPDTPPPQANSQPCADEDSTADSGEDALAGAPAAAPLSAPLSTPNPTPPSGSQTPE